MHPNSNTHQITPESVLAEREKRLTTKIHRGREEAITDFLDFQQMCAKYDVHTLIDARPSLRELLNVARAEMTARNFTMDDVRGSTTGLTATLSTGSVKAL